jgi:muconate cycloisomerase
MEPTQLDIYRTALPMRSFSHAAAQRRLAEAVVVRLTYSDGHVGWGETLPREYVTGETMDSVVEDIAEQIWPACLDGGLLEPSEHPREIPATGGGRRFNAAAAAVDIAALRRVFHEIHKVSPTMLQELAGRPRLRNFIDAKVSGVLGWSDPGKTASRLRLMRWGEMKDYKLKLGLGEDVDRENLRIVHRKLRRKLRKGLATLRVDINGAWDVETTPERIEELKQYDICCVEQPVFCSAGKFVDLARRCSLPLMADETLLTDRHAKTLLDEPEKVWWNLRISKNGGMLPTLKLMQLAFEHDVPFTLGCMVGESSILAAAQRRVLQLGPPPRFCEGSFGRVLLLQDDFLRGRRSLRMGWAGSLKILNGDGLGIEVCQRKVDKYGQLVRTLKA